MAYLTGAAGAPTLCPKILKLSLFGFSIDILILNFELQKLI
jgi:hypothetical protein